MKGTLLALALGLAGLLAALWLAAGRDAARERRAQAPRGAADDSATLRELAAARPPPERAPDDAARAPAEPAARREPPPDASEAPRAVAKAADDAIPRGTLRGRVRRAGGAPVEGARVEAFPAAGLRKSSPLGSAITDDAGRFELVCVGSGPFRVAAERGDAYGIATSTELSGVEAGADGLELLLADVSTLRGSVADARGAPVTSFWLRLEPLDELARRASELPSHRVYGDGGLFDFELPHGEWRVALPADGERAAWSEVVRVPRADPLAIVLAPRVQLRVAGRVVGPHGEPVSGAEIEADERVVLRSDADGRFDVGVDGAASAWIQARDATRSSERVAATHVSGELLLRLGPPQRPGRVAGRVVDERGAPIAGATVFAQRATSSTSERTDEAGEFSFALPAGVHRVRTPGPREQETLESAEAGGSLRRVEVVADGTTRVELVGAPRATLEVVVLAAGGAGAAGARVSARDARGNARGEAGCDAAGRARLTLDEGSFEVVARAPSGARDVRSRPRDVRLESGKSAELRLLLEPATRVVTRCVDASGEVRARVEALDRAGRAFASEESGELVLVAPGPYLLRAAATRGRKGEREISLDGAPPRLEVELRVE